MTVTPLAEALYHAAVKQLTAERLASVTSYCALCNGPCSYRAYHQPGLTYSPPVSRQEKWLTSPSGQASFARGNALEDVVDLMGVTFADTRSAVLPPAGAR